MGKTFAAPPLLTPYELALAQTTARRDRRNHCVSELVPATVSEAVHELWLDAYRTELRRLRHLDSILATA